MKFLFSPAGVVIVLVVLAVIFWPRRLPDAAKPFRRRMTVFHDDEPPAQADSPSGENADAKRGTG